MILNDIERTVLCNAREYRTNAEFMDAIEAAVIAKLSQGVEMPEPFPAGYIAQTEYFYTADQLRAVAAAARLKALEALQAEANTSQQEYVEQMNIAVRKATELVHVKAELDERKQTFDDMMKERNAVLARLAELEQQEPDLYVHNDGLSVWGAQSNPKLASDPTYTAYYAAAGASLEPSALQDENAKLITALAECRGAFPVPSQGSELDDWYVGAVSDPLAVPEYVRACVRASPVETSQAQPDTWVDNGGWAFPMEQPSQAGELSDDDWLNLAERHACADWGSDKPDGYLLAVKALASDYSAIIAAINAKDTK